MKDLKSPIYLDYASTTPIDKRVAEKMFEYMTTDGKYGNPASRSHSFGWDADDAVTQSRQHIADLINADPREIVWTSGAQSQITLRLKGRHIFTRRKVSI